MNSGTGDDLMTSIDMNDNEYRIALMLFLVAYSLFEAPSNLAMKKFTPQCENLHPDGLMGILFALLTLVTSWLAFLVICFGALCAGIGGSKNVPTLMALRFLLGASEAGVYPGMIFFLASGTDRVNEPSESLSSSAVPH